MFITGSRRVVRVQRVSLDAFVICNDGAGKGVGVRKLPMSG